uniref:Uncharacterized protein n=1 Tax=Davidia involucrata TaxID=16924 RepID=A0A5B6YU18_DAVIN
MNSSGQLLQQQRLQIHHPSLSPSLLKTKHKPSLLVFPRKCSYSSSDARFLGFPIPFDTISEFGSSRLLVSRRVSEKFADAFEPDQPPNYVSEPTEILKQKEASFVNILKGANSVLPQVVLASTILALIYPPSFTWFTNRSLNIL